METWRAQLWLTALVLQGPATAEDAQALQQCFNDTRLQAFQFDEAVKVLAL